MPKVKSEKRNENDPTKQTEKKTSGWGAGGQLFGTEANENTFQGAGFKDKEKANETLRLLDGRDITYQFQIINSMYNRAKVIYKRTTDKEKRQNLNDAIEIFEKWIDDYKANSRSKENFSYLPLEIMESYEPLAKHYNITDIGFLQAFKDVDGEIKALRSKKVPDEEITWDVQRNKNLKILKTKIKENYIPLFETDEPMRGLPTKEHVELIMWGYSNDLTKIKKCIPLIEEKVK
ncbi:uracil-DNA degrading factor [Lycorma delicatula]|uniref:uracil-DNA degrading factor n=1 Tax=Lycorma delicatula TaxID=130591 RepID=UPI003F510765